MTTLLHSVMFHQPARAYHHLYSRFGIKLTSKFPVVRFTLKTSKLSRLCSTIKGHQKTDEIGLHVIDIKTGEYGRVMEKKGGWWTISFDDDNVEKGGEIVVSKYWFNK